LLYCIAGVVYYFAPQRAVNGAIALLSETYIRVSDARETNQKWANCLVLRLKIMLSLKGKES